MKKVWILEGFVSREHMEKELENLLKMNEFEHRKVPDLDMVDVYKKAIEKHPNGYWAPWQGKTIYKQFCECAQETLRNMRKKKMQWRVVEAQIEDNATTWVGYKITKENEGVMKYLWATL